MNIYFIVDIVIVCVALGIIMRCWKQGLVSSVIRLVGTIISYAGAWMLSGTVSEMLYGSFVKDKLLSYAKTLVPADLQKLADGVAASGVNADALKALGIGDISKAVGEYLEGMLRDMGINSLPFKPVDTAGLGKKLTSRVLEDGATVAEAITEFMLQPIAMTVLRVVAFAVIFGLLSFAVSMLYRIGFGFNHLPLLGSFNHLLGAGVGLLEAAIVVYILCMVLAAASALLGGKIDFLQWNNLQKAQLFSSIVGIKLPAGLGLL